MGAIAEAIKEYARPLLEESDGSLEETEHAMMLATCCWNLAMMPEDAREATIADMQSRLQMNDADFETLRHGVVEPMIARYHAMFSNGPNVGSMQPSNSAGSPPTGPATVAGTRKSRRIGRNAPCPCNSGKKYKHCCGR